MTQCVGISSPVDAERSSETALGGDPSNVRSFRSMSELVTQLERDIVFRKLRGKAENKVS